MAIATALVLFLCLLLSVGFLVRWVRIAQHLPWISADSSHVGDQALPKVSVIVPVRDEEDNIEQCLSSLLAQDYKNLEIIVVDDQSKDRTPDILAHIKAAHEERTMGLHGGSYPELIVVHGKACPADWVGKNHALYQGYKIAQGDFLVFMDADTRAHPKLITATVGFARQTGTGLLTLLHPCEFQCFWDSVANSLIFYLALFQKIERFNDPDDRAANAHGPFLLFSRDAYEAIGGHEAIKSEVVEDQVLAERIKEKKKGLVWAITPDLVVSRPYASLADLRKGWGKVLFRGIERNPKVLYIDLVSPLFLALYFVMPWLSVLVTVVHTVASGGNPTLVAIFALACSQILTVIATLRVLAILFRLQPMYPAAYPLGAFILAWLQIEAALRYLTGRKVTWKGRSYRERAY